MRNTVAALLTAALLLTVLACRQDEATRDSKPSGRVPATSANRDESAGPRARFQAIDAGQATAGDSLGGSISSQPFSRDAPADVTVGFEDLPADRTGVDFTNAWQAPEKLERALSSSFAAGGVSIGDFDDDALADLYLSRPFGGGKLYRNLGDFRFEDVTASSGLQADQPFWEAGCSFADIDGDGDLDLFVCAFDSPNRLYRNEGGKFREVAGSAGLNFKGASVMMAFADYDRDGDLDGYLVTNRAFSPTGDYNVADRAVAQRVFPQLERKDDKFLMPEHLREIFDIRWNPYRKIDVFIRAGQYDRLYRNDGPSAPGGPPRFTDVTDDAGLRDNGLGLSATWWDCDDDGYPDLYVANDYFGADRLYRNLGNGKFSEVSTELLPHTPWYSMGSNVADLNNDGMFDFLGTDMSGTDHFRQKIGMGDMSKNAWFLDTAHPRQYMRNAIYINSGAGRFFEAAHLTGLAKSDWTWAIKTGDLDNDGRTDVFIANGMSGDFFNSDILQAKRAGTYLRPGQAEPRPEPKRDRNLAFRNQGDLRFTDIGADWGLDNSAASFGAALGDLDGDGDLDLVVNNFEEPVSLYRNRAAGSDGRHSIRVRLIGKESNRWGIDARVRIETAEGIQARLLTLSRGFYASDEPVLHFGLGAEDKIMRLSVEWPSGVVQEFRDLAADRFYTITESQTSTGKPFREIRRNRQEGPMFAPSEKLRGIRHTERPFDDYERQPLLPQKYSQLGPGAAWADVDGDRDDDLFVGQSSGDAGQLYMNEGARFVFDEDGPFDKDKACEDMAPLFFDVDGDGDRDLFVVSGSVECEPGEALLRDRLYLNDGDGEFSHAPPGMLPDLRDSGGVACVADYDRDGDLDLFVGGRSIPGRYPEVPASRLLRNDGAGNFSDATPAALQQTGLVTGALWSDADGDGWIDLLVTHEWGPVKIFHNSAGKLEDATATAGIGDRTGWFNSIAGRDIDGDGDIDYVVGNFGLNVKYHATPERPALLYYGDLDGSGRSRIVEAEFEGAICYPIRGKSCSSQAMPVLQKRFRTFEKFALAELADIYTATRLDGALQLSANTLESGILINVTPHGGKPRFEFRALPRIAQVSPIFGLALTEVDGDGHPDLYLVQNFFSPQRETGRMDGGLSLLLRGSNEGVFQPIWPDRSGLVVAGDAKGLTATDFNADGRPDFFVSINDGEQLAFENRATAASDQFLVVQLQGRPGNVDAVGARVTLVPKPDSNLPNQTAEVAAGGGYLSQSSPRLFFGLGDEGRDGLEQIAVRWPDGEVAHYRLDELTVEEGRVWISR